MKDMNKTDRAAIMERITKMLTEADDKTLREMERLLMGWRAFRRKQERV